MKQNETQFDFALRLWKEAKRKEAEIIDDYLLELLLEETTYDN